MNKNGLIDSSTVISVRNGSWVSDAISLAGIGVVILMLIVIMSKLGIIIGFVVLVVFFASALFYYTKVINQ